MDDFPGLNIEDVACWSLDSLATDDLLNLSGMEWNPVTNDLDRVSPLLPEDCSSLLESSIDFCSDLDLCLSTSGTPDDDTSWTSRSPSNNLDSTGHSSLNSPSSIDDLFPSSVFPDSMFDANFSFVDTLTQLQNAQSITEDFGLQQSFPQPYASEPKPQPAVKLETPSTASGVQTRRRRQTSAAKPAPRAAAAGTGKRRGRPEKDARATTATTFQQGAIELKTAAPSTNEGVRSSRPAAGSKAPILRMPASESQMKATQELMQQMSACHCEELASKARAITRAKTQPARPTPILQDCSLHRSAVTAAEAQMRKRMRECTMVCWLFRTLLTAEYRALPLNGIFEVFEETFSNPTTAHGRHWRQSIRHCLMSSAVFVRVLTPNPRKDFLVMNEAGSWWTVHPDTESLCAREVFAHGAGHRCPPQQGVPYRLRFGKTGDRPFENRATAYMGERIYRTPPAFPHRKISRQPVKTHFYRQQVLQPKHPAQTTPLTAPLRGDQLVVDHEEEVC